MQIPVRNNKVAIFDRHILLIGSYNWMTAAEQSNDEDAIFVRTSVIAAYESAFRELRDDDVIDRGIAISLCPEKMS